MKRLVLLCLATATAVALMFVPSATAVVPNFTLDEPVNNTKITGFLAINGSSSNVDIDAWCTIPNVAPLVTYDKCDYNDRDISVGYAISSQLPEGSHTLSIHIVARDGSNQWVDITRTIIVDRTPPTISLYSGPGDEHTVHGRDFNWSFGANESVTFTCALDDGTPASCSGSFAATDLTDGDHTLTITANDGLHQSTRNWTFTVSNPPPVISFDDVVAHQAGATAAVPWSTDVALARSECTLDDDLATVYSPCPQSFNGLSAGLHTLHLEVEGEWDNVASAEVEFTMYPLPPQTMLVAGQEVDDVVDSASFDFSSDLETATFECRIDNAAWIDCVSPLVIGAGELTPGVHSFEVRAVDPVDQADETPVSTTFTLNGPAAPAPPTTPPTGSPSPPSHVKPPKLSSFTAKGRAVTLRSTGAGKLALKVESCKTKKVRNKRRTVCKRVGSDTATAKRSGKVKFKLKKKLKKGVKYRLTVTATSSTGQKAKTMRTVKAR